MIPPRSLSLHRTVAESLAEKREREMRMNGGARSRRAVTSRSEPKLPIAPGRVQSALRPSPESSEVTAVSSGFDPAFQHVLRSAQTGADWAFTRLYESLAPAVADYVRARGADDPDDLTSEVFIKVFTGCDSFAGTEAQFRSWVFAIARCRLIDARRAKTRIEDARILNRENLQDVQGRTGAAAEDEAMARLAAEPVAQLLGELSPGQRDVLVLRLIAGMSVEEVAAALAKPPTAVKALQRRALATLRRRLGVQTPGPASTSPTSGTQVAEPPSGEAPP